METVVCLVNIKDGALLLVKKRSHWIIPGGKPEKGESYLDTLVREFSEELPSAKISIGSYYKSFTGKTPNSKSDMVAKVYLGEIIGNIIPSAEISDAKFIRDFENYNLSEVANKVVDDLRKGRYLKNG